MYAIFYTSSTLAEKSTAQNADKLRALGLKALFVIANVISQEHASSASSAQTRSNLPFSLLTSSVNHSGVPLEAYSKQFSISCNEESAIFNSGKYANKLVVPTNGKLPIECIVNRNYDTNIEQTVYVASPDNPDMRHLVEHLESACLMMK
ncbi:MAG: hypothetical protein LBP35_01885 [Candidatus Ancillula trichonymphae]|nr:hypothetical protein [Candidatus Ancillula trichonymphae]